MFKVICKLWKEQNSNDVRHFWPCVREKNSEFYAQTFKLTHQSDQFRSENLTGSFSPCSLLRTFTKRLSALLIFGSYLLYLALLIFLHVATFSISFF